MIVPAYVIDQDTGETLGRFGLEVDVRPGLDPPYLPQRWGLARAYTVPAYGPGGHGWGAWGGALLILLSVYGLIAFGVWR